MSYTRDFKLNNDEYLIVDSNDSNSKYHVLVLDKNLFLWKKLFKCNSLKEGHEKAAQRLITIESSKQTEEFENQQFQKLIDRLNEIKILCNVCGSELSLQEKIDNHPEEDDLTCINCIKNIIE